MPREPTHVGRVGASLRLDQLLLLVEQHSRLVTGGLDVLRVASFIVYLKTFVLSPLSSL